MKKLLVFGVSLSIASALAAQTATPTNTRTPTRTPTLIAASNAVRQYPMVQFTAAGAILPGRFVGYDNRNVAASGGPVKGLSLKVMASGEVGQLMAGGAAEVLCARATVVRAGDPVMSDGAGLAAPAGADDFVAGFALEDHRSGSNAPCKVMLAIGARALPTFTYTNTPTSTPTPTATRTPTP
jgi:hypothetical protein